METYRDWQLFDFLPDGWKIDKTAGSPLCGYEFCTDGKSILKGGKRALVRIVKAGREWVQTEAITETIKNDGPKEEQVIDANYVRTVNELARKKFEERMLRDIAVDLMICEIEGWCKMEYIRELRRLLAGLARRKATNIQVGAVEQIAFEL